MGGIVVDLVHPHGEIVRHQDLLGQSHQHPAQPGGGRVVVEAVLQVQLGQDVLGPLDGPGHQLGKEEHVDGVDAQVTLCRALSPVDVDGIGKRLEGMEREPDGQDEIEAGDAPLQAQRLDDPLQVVAEEIQVLEGPEQAQVGHQAHQQDPLPHPPRRALQGQARRVVDGDERQQEHDVLRDEGHVEVAAGQEQQHPAPPLGDVEVQEDDDGEEVQEMDRVEEHPGDSLQRMDVQVGRAPLLLLPPASGAPTARIS